MLAGPHLGSLASAVRGAASPSPRDHCHPQYLGFIAIMVGFLVQWPTILTLAMFPFLVLMYVRLARAEERDAVETFGDLYRQYAAATPAWIPKVGSRQVGSSGKRARR